MRAQLSVIEAGISAIIIISAAVAVADAAYGMSALQRTDSTNISNLAYDFSVLLRYNASVAGCFAGNNSSCKAAILQHLRSIYGAEYLSYEYQGVAVHSGKETSCSSGYMKEYCFAFKNATVACIGSCGV